MNKNKVLNFEEIQKSLVEKSYVQVPFPIERSTIESAVEAFFKFLEEPQSVKEHIQFSIAPLHRRGDVGYVHRDASDHVYNDDKEFFHFHPAVFERYGDFLEAHPVVKDFVVKAKPIWDAAYQTVKEVLQT